MARSFASIPVPSALPLVGHTLPYFFNTIDFVRRARDRYGDVVRFRVAGEDSVVFFGPDAVEFVLVDREDNFSAGGGWGFRLGRFFRGGLLIRDGDDHRHSRRIMAGAFRPGPMKEYLTILTRVMDQELDGWQDQKDFRFYPAFKQLSLQVAASCFLGITSTRETARVNAAFMDTVAATMALIRYPLPGTAWHRGVRGRRYLEEYLTAMLPEKRRQESGDIFSRFCHATDEKGERFTDKEVVDHMIFLLMAAHDTITSSASSLAWLLAQHTEWQDRLYQELPEGELSLAGLSRMKAHEWCFHEALRLYPPLHTVPRRSLRDLEYAGYRIPAGTVVQTSIATTHRLDKFWQNPDAFEPERFAPPREENKQHPYLFTPFGAGPHICIGMGFAGMQIKAFLHSFLRRYRTSPRPGQQFRVNFIPIPKPVDDLPLILTRR